MPFPYAYYREEYNGPLHGTSLTSNVLYLTPKTAPLITGGEVDVTDISHIFVDTSAGNIVIDGFVNAKNGQVIFIYKTTAANSLSIKHNSSGTTLGKIYTSNKQAAVLGHGYFGGTSFISREGSAGSFTWYQLDNNGFFATGNQANPSIAFSEDPDTGLFNKIANVIGFTTSGIERLSLGTKLILSVPANFADGSAIAPSLSFASDSDTGFYKASDKIIFSADGIDTLALTKTGNLNSIDAVNLTAFDELTPQRLRVGSLLVSDDLVDDIDVPSEGIYSKGNVKTSGIFEGQATSARFADLAERYEADAIYPKGTIIAFGGSKEITIAGTKEAFGVISSNPGFVLNADAGTDDTHPAIALYGRVPCRVIGKVKKHDSIWSCGGGIGKVASNGCYTKIGRALEDKDTEDEGLVMISTRAVI